MPNPKWLDRLDKKTGYDEETGTFTGPVVEDETPPIKKRKSKKKTAKRVQRPLGSWKGNLRVKYKFTLYCPRCWLTYQKADYGYPMLRCGNCGLEMKLDKKERVQDEKG